MASTSDRSAALTFRRADFILLALYSYNSTMCQGQKKNRPAGFNSEKRHTGPKVLHGPDEDCEWKARRMLQGNYDHDLVIFRMFSC